MKEQLALLPGYLAAHLALSLSALIIGICLSVPLGILASRSRRLEPAVVGLASVLQTIPSLALLAFMVPALAALGAPSIGFLPALIGLAVYSLLPILTNTVAGFTGLDPAVLEAARGVGMTPRESLIKVELPLALPVILAGIRTSAVLTVGTAVLATPVGATSLGAYIFGGLQTRNYAAVLVGCAGSALLALTIDALIRGLGLGYERRRRGLVAACLGGLALLAALGLSPSLMESSPLRPIVVGAKPFTESYILAEVLAGQAARRTGLPTRALGSLGSTVIFDALTTGELDAYVDYSGTLWATVLGHGEPRPPRAQLLDQISQELEDRFGVQVVAALGFENTYALAMKRSEAARLGLRRLSDLTLHAPRLKVGGDYEIFQRPEWAAITGGYGLSFAEQRSMDPSLMYEAARAGDVDLISAFSTDGRVAAYDLMVLEDDRGVIPPYDAVILASPQVQAAHPEVIEAWRALGGTLDVTAMQRLNSQVDSQGQRPAEAAAGFLGGI